MNTKIKSLCALLMALFTAVSAQAVTLSLLPAVQTAGPADSVEVFLHISGLGDGGPPSLGGFNVALGYNPDVLGYDSTEFGTMLGPLYGSVSEASNDPETGSLELFAVSLDDPETLDLLQPDDFLLATIRFTAIATGESPVDFIWLSLADENGVDLDLDAIEIATVIVVTDGVIPEIHWPGLALVIAGLTAGALKRMRSA